MSVEKECSYMIEGKSKLKHEFDVYRYRENLKANDVCCVYVFLKKTNSSPILFKVIYVGQTKHLNDRWRAHQSDDIDKSLEKGMTHIGVHKCQLPRG